MDSENICSHIVQEAASLDEIGMGGWQGLKRLLLRTVNRAAVVRPGGFAGLVQAHGAHRPLNGRPGAVKSGPSQIDPASRGSCAGYEAAGSQTSRVIYSDA